MVKKLIKKVASKIKRDNENGARVSVLEDLFYDFHRNRKQVYLMNFIRGIFFGLGSALGATVLIAVVLALLNLFADVPGGIGDFIQRIIDEVQKPRSSV